MNITKKCMQCHSFFSVAVPKKSKATKRKFCNLKCAGAHDSANRPALAPNKECCGCQKPLYRNAARRERRAFCSRICKNKARLPWSEEVLRRHAGSADWVAIQNFYDEGHSIPECVIKFNLSKAYLFKGCKRGKIKTRGYAEASRLTRINGRYPTKIKDIYKTAETKRFYSSGAWKELRAKALERDNYTCGDCDKRGGYLEINHINPRSSNPKLSLELTNLETLCRPCHCKKMHIVVEGLRKLKEVGRI